MFNLGESEIKVMPKDLFSFIYNVAVASGLSQIHATYLCEGILYASISGYDSHGFRLFENYCNQLVSGRANKDPKIVFNKVKHGMVIMDADRSLGWVAGRIASDEVIKMAEEQGIAIFGVKNSNHFGPASYYTSMMAEKGYIGIALSNANPLVASPSSHKPAIGTNPISIAAKGEGDDLFCLDMSSSQGTLLKIKKFAEDGERIDRSWALTANGEETDDPRQAAVLKPLGGSKGFALAVAIELLCSILSDGSFPWELEYNFAEKRKSERDHFSHTFIAISPFDSGFYHRVSMLLKYLRNLPQSHENNQPRSPGDRAKKIKLLREKDGIPLLKDDVESIERLAKNFDVKTPTLLGNK